MPQISVIVPAYNCEAALEECLGALLAQDYPADQYEVIAVDNNSTDASADIIRLHSRVRLLREPKQGAYAARNRGLREAKGEILAFTDSDCVPRPDWLSRIDRVMRDPHLQIVIGRVAPGESSRVLDLLGAYEHHKDRYVFATQAPEKYYGHAGNMAVRRDMLAALGPFIERQRGADAIFVRHSTARFGCYCVRYEPQMFVRHLEVNSFLAYFRKTYTYGRARRQGNRLALVRPLTMGERFHVFRTTVNDESLSLIDASTLLMLLVVGFGCWLGGSLSGHRATAG